MGQLAPFQATPNLIVVRDGDDVQPRPMGGVIEDFLNACPSQLYVEWMCISASPTVQRSFPVSECVRAAADARPILPAVC